ncbi:hypothetical protein K458DRAFT_288850 [Lentithecium fluviatile CBS 122367]|uniref:Uncharacterized protein n=1 Tax=Lentithecium fluviatile CBS 122367 TaxID=1168545 RepID=A0A6G1JKY3_9PLEO|nr:hypothetical protein K458DRAFT_288850 [Lentithecium fluviatile CBS 122367]
MQETRIWIILAVVLGCLVLALAVVFLLFCRRRSKKRVRGFGLRAVTPLDDAEFESWRRPSQYTQRPEKYGIRPTQPAAVRTTKPSPMLEKEINYEPPRTPSPHDIASAQSPSTPVRKPERVQRKSSVCSSLADRPPTPYSPASATSEFPRSSYGSRKSGVGSPRIHYPSMSEASAFNFNFNLDFDPHARDPARQSDDRPLNLSYGHGWHSDKV